MRMTQALLEDTISPLQSASESEMKRDMDLIRDILLAFDANPKLDGRLVHRGRVGAFFEKEGVSEDEAAHGLRLLMDRQFVVGSYDRASDMFGLERLSMDGHDFLDLIRDHDVWDKTKNAALATRGFTLDLLFALAKGIIKKTMEDITGIPL
jgi:Hypothetical protein (DUF2513)